MTLIGRFSPPTKQELIARGPVFTLFDFAFLIDSPSGQARWRSLWLPVDSGQSLHENNPVGSGHVHRGEHRPPKRPGPHATVRSRTLPLNEAARRGFVKER